MGILKNLAATAALSLTALASPALLAPAWAADPIRVGVIFAFSGPFAGAGKAVQTAIEIFQKEHGTTVAGREVEILLRDSTGPAPDVATRLATELVTRDKVDILTGLDFTPNAIAVANVANRAGVPAISMNASGLPFTKVAQTGARFSFTLPQQVAPLAKWAAANDMGRVYTLVADFTPGVEAEETFVEQFTAAGGEIAGSVRVPLANPDFAPFMQRIREASPDAVFVFLPSGGGDLPTLFFRAVQQSGLADDGVKVIGTGETDEQTIDTLGAAALGVITAFHYATSHDSAENKAFVTAFEQATGGQQRASFGAAQAYDTMAAIYRAIEAQNGDVSTEGFMQALRGQTFDGLRGPIAIGDDGEITQTIYLRRVEEVNGRLENVEFDSVPNASATGH